MSKPLCKECGNRPCESIGGGKLSSKCWKCRRPHKKRTTMGSKQRKRNRLRNKHLKSFCEFCGFKAVHLSQLDLDHIDGNHDNNNKDNLQTLCANCHRLKTFLNKDWK